MTAVLPTETPVAAVAPSGTCAAGGDERRWRVDVEGALGGLQDLPWTELPEHLLCSHERWLVDSIPIPRSVL